MEHFHQSTLSLFSIKSQSPAGRGHTPNYKMIIWFLQLVHAWILILFWAWKNNWVQTCLLKAWMDFAILLLLELSIMPSLKDTTFKWVWTRRWWTKAHILALAICACTISFMNQVKPTTRARIVSDIWVHGTNSLHVSASMVNTSNWWWQMRSLHQLCLCRNSRHPTVRMIRRKMSMLYDSNTLTIEWDHTILE